MTDPSEPTDPTDLVAGQNIPWSDQVATVYLRGRADASALLLGADGKVRDDEDLVFYNAPAAGGVSWEALSDDEQRLRIDTAAVPPEIEVVRVLVSVDDDQPPLADGAVVATVRGTNAAAQYAPHRLDGERCLIWFDLYRRAGGWKVRAVGQGWKDGLAAGLGAHGIAVEAPEPTPAAAPTTPTAPPPATAPGQSPGFAPSRSMDHPSAPLTPGPDDDTVAGALRAIRSLRRDISQARLAHLTAVGYAQNKLLETDEIARNSPDSGLPGARHEYSALMAQADARYATEAASLRDELVAEELAMPLPLARLDSFDWDRLTGLPAVGGAPDRGIDTHDLTAEVIRLGSLYPPEGERLNVPMAHGWAGRPLIWAEGSDRAPSGVAWVHGLIARMMALTSPGGFDVQLVDLDGSLSSGMGTLGAPIAADITRHASPGELSAFVDELAHLCDLAKMAIESGVSGALQDVRDGARHLVVLGHWPHAYDARAQARITECMPWLFALSVQLVVLCHESDLPERGSSTPGGSPGAEGPLRDLLDHSLVLDDAGAASLIDDAGVAWCYDPELTPAARSVAGRITASGQRA